MNTIFRSDAFWLHLCILCTEKYHFPYRLCDWYTIAAQESIWGDMKMTANRADLTYQNIIYFSVPFVQKFEFLFTQFL